jgi:hypothetical protein
MDTPPYISVNAPGRRRRTKLLLNFKFIVMKTFLLKFSVAFLLLALLGAGCDEEDDGTWEISPQSKNPVILKEVKGIEFKFCLLNEQGEPSTVFNEGENFTFYFSVTNNRDEDLNFDPGFAYSNENDFCKVFDSKHQDLGKPFLFLGYDKVGSGAYPFLKGQMYVFEQQWLDNRESTWRWQYGYFESASLPPLSNGNYYTDFKYRFRFARTHEEPALYTDTLNFKINFKIQ